MNVQTRSLRPFIGARDFELSRSFYTAFGFEETVIDSRLSVFKLNNTAFYLQDAYLKDWIDNTMVFLEMENLDHFWTHLQTLDLPGRFPGVRIEPIRQLPWGRECFIHDPSGVLWHVGEFV
ncbi:MAG: glyoxalase [Chitinophagaceae bacterium]